jgi:hypothetical protein
MKGYGSLAVYMFSYLVHYTVNMTDLLSAYTIAN